jgi:hypothetical protein
VFLILHVTLDRTAIEFKLVMFAYYLVTSILLIIRLCSFCCAGSTYCFFILFLVVLRCVDLLSHLLFIINDSFLEFRIVNAGDKA